MAFNRMFTKHRRKPQTRFLVRLITAMTCALFATAPALAQGVRGTIRGTVTDPNGAVIKGAAVTLIDLARQTEIRTVQTNDEGEYQFLELEPATYNIRITAGDFTEALLRETKVEPNRNLQLDAALSVGGTIDEITVTATQELIDRETPTLGTTVDPRRVVGLPLDGRNVLNHRSRISSTASLSTVARLIARSFSLAGSCAASKDYQSWSPQVDKRRAVCSTSAVPIRF